MFAGAGYVCVLRSLIAATQQQYDLLARNSVINPVASAHINAKFPYAITAEFVVAKIALLYAVHAPINRDSCRDVTLLF